MNKKHYLVNQKCVVLLVNTNTSASGEILSIVPPATCISRMYRTLPYSIDYVHTDRYMLAKFVGGHAGSNLGFTYGAIIPKSFEIRRMKPKSMLVRYMIITVSYWVSGINTVHTVSTVTTTVMSVPF
jgi:hypothetical protein